MWQNTLISKCLTHALTKRLCLSKRFLTTTPSSLLDQRWRLERGLPMNNNAEGALTDGPDYSFLDGRPTPYTSGQMRRVLKQRQVAEQIINLTAEVDFAVERHERLQQDEEERKQRIIESKLKPKGIELLKNKKKKDQRVA